jgi:hypothetical protein
MKLRVVVFLVLAFYLIAPAFAWDMGGNSTTYPTSSNSLVGKTVQIAEVYGDGYYLDIITTITGVSNGILEVNDVYTRKNNQGTWSKSAGKQYIGISQITFMWPDSIPTDVVSSSSNVKTPEFDGSLAIVSMAVIALCIGLWRRHG